MPTATRPAFSSATKAMCTAAVSGSWTATRSPALEAGRDEDARELIRRLGVLAPADPVGLGDERGRIRAGGGMAGDVVGERLVAPPSPVAVLPRERASVRGHARSPSHVFRPLLAAHAGGSAERGEPGFLFRRGLLSADRAQRHLALQDRQHEGEHQHDRSDQERDGQRGR